LAEARGLVAQAQKAGVDPAPVVKLLDQAEALLSQGRLPETAAKMQEAFGVMREMAARFHQRGGGPGGRGRMRGGPGPGPGPDPGFVAQLAGALVGQLQSESPVLHSVMEDLDNAGGAMLDKNPGQVREILARATNKLTGIRESRNALSDEIARAEKRAAGAHSRGRRPSTSPGEPPTVPQPHPDLKPLRDLLGRAFDEVRTLSPEEYGKRKDEFVRRLVGSLLGPTQTPLGPPGGPVAQTSLPPIEAPAEEPTKPEERDRLESVVRDRLRLLQEPYTALGEAGVDMQDVGRLIQQARTAVNEGRLREAAQSANHASDLVCQLVDLHRDELQKQ
jgi:hypothetical protein